MFLYPHHVLYVVYNLREMADYLKKNFDMDPWRVDEHPKNGFRTLLYRAGPTMIDFSEPLVDENGEALVQGGGAMMMANLLKERGPGLFHVAWGVENIDKLYADLEKKGNAMDRRGHHNHPLHDSMHTWYKVFNVLPISIGPSFENAVRGVFFQCAEGQPSAEELKQKGNLDLTNYPLPNQAKKATA